jgi:hypothetical protein
MYIQTSVNVRPQEKILLDRLVDQKIIGYKVSEQYVIDGDGKSYTLGLLQFEGDRILEIISGNGNIDFIWTHFQYANINHDDITPLDWPATMLDWKVSQQWGEYITLRIVTDQGTMLVTVQQELPRVVSTGWYAKEWYPEE